MLDFCCQHSHVNGLCLFSLFAQCLAVRSGPEQWPCRSLWGQIMSICWTESVYVFLYENLSLHALDNVIIRLGETYLCWRERESGSMLERLGKYHTEEPHNLMKCISLFYQVNLLLKFTAAVAFLSAGSVCLCPEPFIGANVQGIDWIPSTGAIEKKLRPSGFIVVAHALAACDCVL